MGNKRQFQGHLTPGEFQAIAAVPRRFADDRARRAVVALEYAEKTFAEFGPGSDYFGLTKGQFSMIDIVRALLAKTGPAHVSLWTWCIADYEVQAVTGLMQDGRVKSLRLVMDVAGLKRDAPLVSDLQAKFGADCVRATKTHAKVATIRTDNADGLHAWRIVARGSMNLNENPRFEQFDVSDDPAVFDCVASIEREMWQKGAAIQARNVEHSDADDLFRKAGEVPACEWFKPSAEPWHA